MNKKDVFLIIFSILYVLLILFKFKVSSVILSMLWLSYSIILFIEIITEKKLLRKKMGKIVACIFILFYSYEAFLKFLNLELPYVQNSFKMKKEISKQENIFYNGKKIDSELIEEIKKKLSITEIFFGDTEYISRDLDKIYVINLDEALKIKIFKDNLNNNFYLNITEIYYKKLEVDLD